MSNRVLAVAVFVALAVAGAARTQEEPGVYLKEERPLPPADKNFKEALAKPKEEAPMNDNLKRDIEIVVRHAVYALAPADAEKKVQNTPQQMSRMVDAAV